MRKKNGGWRFLYKLHRYAGLVSAIVLLMLAVTGIALNHTDDLMLDSRMVKSPALLNWYGIKAPANLTSHLTRHHRITLANQQLYFNTTLILTNIPQLIGAVETEEFIVIALNESLLLLSLQGELIETLPFHAINNIGLTPQYAIIIRSDSGLSLSEDGLLSWQTAKDKDIVWSIPAPLPSSLTQNIKNQFRSSILPYERVFLDIHSGRFFGLFGVILVDISGVLLIILALSGGAIWLKHKIRSLKRR